eukprot:scaffold170202_cov32-Tisochrysis_lutea.AAC.2
MSEKLKPLDEKENLTNGTSLRARAQPPTRNSNCVPPLSRLSAVLRLLGAPDGRQCRLIHARATNGDNDRVCARLFVPR